MPSIFPFAETIHYLFCYWQAAIAQKGVSIVYLGEKQQALDIHCNEQYPIASLWQEEDIAANTTTERWVIADLTDFRSRKQLCPPFWQEKLGATALPAPIAAFLQLTTQHSASILCLHLPTIWLQTAWGQSIQQGLLDDFVIHLVLTLQHADSHCLVLERQNEEVLRNQNMTKFVEWQAASMEALGQTAVLDSLLKTRQNESTPYYKVTCVSQFMLRINAYHWSDYCHAPNVYWDIMKRCKNRFVPLTNLCTMSEGMATPCDDFFVLEDIMEQVYAETQSVITDAYILANINNNIADFQHYDSIAQSHLCIVRNAWGEWWLIETAYLVPYHSHNRTGKCLLLYIKGKPQTSDVYVAAYLASGERRGLPKLVAAASTKPNKLAWYQLNLPMATPLHLLFLSQGMVQTIQGMAWAGKNYLQCQPLQPTQTLLPIFASAWFALLLQINGKHAHLADVVQHFPVPPMLPYAEELPTWSDSLANDLGFAPDGTWSLSNVPTSRHALDDACLLAMGIVNPKERRQFLTAIYATLYHHSLQHKHNAVAAATNTTTKSPSKKEQQLTALQQLIEQQQIDINKTIAFAHQLIPLVEQISRDPRQQKRLFADFWRHHFGERFDFEVLDESDSRLF